LTTTGFSIGFSSSYFSKGEGVIFLTGWITGFYIGDGSSFFSKEFNTAFFTIGAFSMGLSSYCFSKGLA
jgi:hypothetical protein